MGSTPSKIVIEKNILLNKIKRNILIIKISKYSIENETTDKFIDRYLNLCKYFVLNYKKYEHGFKKNVIYNI
jgi:hypothetical protein